MYSVIYAVILDPFPYKDRGPADERRVSQPGSADARRYYSIDQFVEISERATAFEGVIASTVSDASGRARGAAAAAGESLHHEHVRDHGSTAADRAGDRRRAMGRRTPSR